MSTASRSPRLIDGIDAVFIVDVNNWEHLGNIGRTLQARKFPRACIDHHQGRVSGIRGTHGGDTTAAATGGPSHSGTDPRHDGSHHADDRRALFAAIITDTGTFRFSNTDARALHAAADLAMRAAMRSRCTARYSEARLGCGPHAGPGASTLESVAGGQGGRISATLEMVNNAGATHDDIDGFVDLVRAIRGVELVVFFKETTEGDIKVSLRSNGRVDANAMARRFGGGGHTMASGMRLPGPMQNAIEVFLRECARLDDFPVP